MVDRRTFIAALTGALMGPAPLARAQRATRVWRIGILTPGTNTQLASRANAPSPALADAFQGLGYAVGKNVAYVVKTAGGSMERLPAAAAELVSSDVDVIMTQGS